MAKYNYTVNPKFVEKESGKRIVEALIEDLDQLMFKINDLSDEGKIDKGIDGACGQLLSDTEAIQDMLKLSLKKKKF
jgi:hypothetical protein